MERKCRNLNNHICHQWKCEVDLSSWPLAVNLCMKHKCCSQSCLWFQDQHDTSGQVCFVNGLSNIQVREVESRCSFSIAELGADTINSVSYEYSKMAARGGDDCWKKFNHKTRGVEWNWLFNVTINDISVIYVTAHRCAGGLKKKLDLRSGSQRHRHFVG